MECQNSIRFQPSRLQIVFCLVALSFLAVLNLPVLSQETSDSLRFANGLYQQRRYDLAADEFQAFLDRNRDQKTSEVINVHYALATCRLFLGQYAEARKSYESFLDVAPPDHPNRSSAEFRVGETSYLMGDLNAAAKTLEEYLDKSAKDHAQRDSALVYAGDVALRLEKLKDAESYYQSSLKDYPKGRLATRARYGLGRSFSLQGRHKEALEQFDELQKSGGQEWNERAWHQIALENIALKQFAAAGLAVDQLASAGQSSSVLIDARWKLAEALLESKQNDQAEKLLVILTKADPPTSVSIQAASRLAGLFLAQQKGRETLELLVPLLKKLEGQPSAVALIYQSAEAQILVGDKLNARQRLIMLADQYPSDSWADDARLAAADLAAEARDWKSAREQITKLQTETPNSILLDDARLLLARVEAGQDRPEEAAKILESLVNSQARPELLNSATYQLALVYQTLKKDEKARELLAKISQVSMPGGSSEALLLLGQSAFEAKKYAEALDPLQQYLASKSPRLADHALAWLAISQWETGAKQQSNSTMGRLLSEFPKSDTLTPTLVRLGESALEANAHEQSINWLESALKLTKDKQTEARITTDLGYAYTAVNRPDEAAKAFSRASALSESDPATAREASMAAVKVLTKAGQAEKALQQLDLILKSLDRKDLSDFHRDSFLQKARLLVSMGRNADAAKCYSDFADLFLQTADEKQPDNARILSEWAYALLDSDNVEEADRVFQRLLEIYPNSSLGFEARLNLAESAYSEKQFEKIRELITPLTKDPKPEGLSEAIREAALYRLARSELEQKRWEQSRVVWNQIIKEYPDSSLSLEAAFWLGEIAMRTDRPEEASKILAELLTKLKDKEKPPWISTAQIRRVQSLVTLKQWDELQTLADQLLQQDEISKSPEMAGEIHYALGRSYQATAQFEKSRKSYQSVIDLSPPGDLAVRSQFMRGETFFHEKNYREALREFLRVDILYESPAWQSAALLEGGKVYEQLNQPADAADLYRRLLERFPNEPAAAEAKGRLAAISGSSDSVIGSGS